MTQHDVTVVGVGVDTITLKRSEVDAQITMLLEMMVNRHKSPSMADIENMRGQIGVLRAIIDGRFPPKKESFQKVESGFAPNGDRMATPGQRSMYSTA